MSLLKEEKRSQRHFISALSDKVWVIKFAQAYERKWLNKLLCIVDSMLEISFLLTFLFASFSAFWKILNFSVFKAFYLFYKSEFSSQENWGLGRYAIHRSYRFYLNQKSDSLLSVAPSSLIGNRKEKIFSTKMFPAHVFLFKPAV